MQTLFLGNVALTAAGDAHALATGVGRIALKLVMKLLLSPIERLAQASDVAGVLVHRKRQQAERRRCSFPFGYLKHLT
ncbi:hypothetical protein [Nitrobacter sp.]|uniref:hypothetical protein n=1 Tax=Nitrobacter sp. TaxID=29420 RepID=UPI003F6549C9